MPKNLDREKEHFILKLLLLAGEASYKLQFDFPGGVPTAALWAVCVVAARRR